ncbi:MAG: PIN domain nuclease, partial [Stackebrandtia sp.]
ALARLYSQRQLYEQWEHILNEGLIALSAVTELEFLYSARSKADRDQKLTTLRAVFPRIPMTDKACERSRSIQHDLTQRGKHRSAGVVDLLVAASAEHHSLVVLHYDRDFDTIAEVTGQLTRWIVPSGSIS